MRAKRCQGPRLYWKIAQRTRVYNYESYNNNKNNDRITTVYSS